MGVLQENLWVFIYNTVRMFYMLLLLKEYYFGKSYFAKTTFSNALVSDETELDVKWW